LEKKLYNGFDEVRGLLNDLMHQLLSSCIFFEDTLCNSGEERDNFIQADQQLTRAVETTFRIREIVMFHTRRGSI
jgi:hypothetical protein